MYFPYYKSGMSQVAVRQDDGVPISANFPRPTENIEVEECDETSVEGTSTKKRKLDDNDESVQPLNFHGQRIEHHHRDDSRKSPLPYIGMIAEAIDSNAEKKMVLSEIYTYMEEHFSQYLSGKPRWRNTVRHNLSFHKCFVKCECSRRGNRSHYWSIHLDYIDQFKRGNFTKTLSPLRETLNRVSYVHEQELLCRNPHERFRQFFPTPSYQNFLQNTIPRPNSKSYTEVVQTPSTPNILHPLPHPRFLGSQTNSSSMLSGIPRQQLPSHQATPRFFPTPYQFPHLVPVPWQYQHLPMPGTRARHELRPDSEISTYQDTPTTKS